MFGSFANNVLQSAGKKNSDTFESYLTELKTLLNDEDKNIRFFIGSGGGLGHESTSVSVLKRMIDLGMKGVREVIYIEGKEDIIHTLIPQFDPKNPTRPVKLGEATLIFVEYETFTGSNPDTADIGFAGGMDATPFTNYAAILKIKYLFFCMPYLWMQEPSIIQLGEEETNYNINLHQIKELSGETFLKRALHISQPQFGDTEINFFKNSIYKEKLAPFQTLLKAKNEEKILWVPVYGIAQSQGIAKENSATLALFNFINGVALAQEIIPGFKSVVIVVISSLTKEHTYQPLNDALLGDESIVGPQLSGYVKEKNFIERMKILKYSSSKLNSYLAEMESNKDRILLLDMGKLPSYAFNYIYANSSFSGIFEGAATHSLLLNFGVPYFIIPSSLNQSAVDKGFLLYPTLPLNAVTDDIYATALTETSQLLFASYAIWERDLSNTELYFTPAIILSLAMGASIPGNSPGLERYFTELGQFFHNSQEDKILLGTLYMLSYIKSKQ